jgi:xanthine/uracil/vitamin C permease (AzgA family)
MFDFCSNMPLGLAPGIGLSAYLAYGLILGEGLTRQEAFTSVSGFIPKFLSFMRFSK